MEELTASELILLLSIHNPGAIKRHSHTNSENDIMSLMRKRYVIRKRGSLALTPRGLDRIKASLTPEVMEVEVRIGSKVTTFVKNIRKKGLLGEKGSKTYKLVHIIARSSKFKANV